MPRELRYLLGSSVLAWSAKPCWRKCKSKNKLYWINLASILRVVAISVVAKCTWPKPDGNVDLDDWENKYSNENEAADFEKFTDHVEESNSPNQVIIDCSASDEVALQYKGWLSRGIHVVTPNKKANSGPYEYYKSLRNIQRDSYTHYFYEATVGAGLPIISTVKSLEDAGDDIKLIQGIFSGTLSYIFNTLTPDKKFSDVVAEAKANGYTEPDPRDDLSGVDVARKVTILGSRMWFIVGIERYPDQNR